MSDQIGIVGGKGSGKTFFAVELILDLLYDSQEKGLSIVTNIPLNIKNYPNLYNWDWDYLTAYHQSFFDSWKLIDDANVAADRRTELIKKRDDFLAKYPFHNKGGCVFFLDECWRLQSAVGSNVMRNEWLMSFFREARQFTNKQGYSNVIYLITQDLDSIPARVRSLCNKTILCKKPSKAGVHNASIRIYMEGAIKGLDVIEKRVIKTEHVFLKPEVFTAYKSHAMSENSTGGYDKESLKKSTVFQNYKMKFMLPIGFFIAVYMVTSGVSGTTQTLVSKDNAKLFKDKSNDNKDNAKTDEVVSGAGGSVDDIRRDNRDVVSGDDNKARLGALAAPILDAKVKSQVWRISGVIESKKKAKKSIFLTNDKHEIRQISSNDCQFDDFGQYHCQVDGETLIFYKY